MTTPVSCEGTDGPIPGYVAGLCRHRVAESEWRAGFRVCEHCVHNGSLQPVAVVDLRRVLQRVVALGYGCVGITYDDTRDHEPWTVGVQIGREDPNTRLVGGAAHSTGSTLSEAMDSATAESASPSCVECGGRGQHKFSCVTGGYYPTHVPAVEQPDGTLHAQIPADQRLWRVTVDIPLHVSVEQRCALIDAVAAAVFKWQPKDRAGWDPIVYGAPAVDEPEDGKGGHHG